MYMKKKKKKKIYSASHSYKAQHKSERFQNR